MTRTVMPHPALHSGQTLGFHSAIPGTTSSSGTNRMIWFSGLPQLASVALVPVMAVSLMKSRRSTSVVAGQAVVGRLLLRVAVHAEAHVVIDDALGHGLIVEIAVAGGAVHARSEV